MNRRESLRTIALGSAGVTLPIPGWTRTPPGTLTPLPPPDEIRGAEHRMPVGDKDPQRIHLVAPRQFIDSQHRLPENIRPTPIETFSADALLGSLAAGEAMIWIGHPAKVPKELSVGAFAVSEKETTISATAANPLGITDFSFGKSVAHSAFISFPKDMPYHNVDEEVRADFLPVLEARDRFGNIAGYPGVVMNYYAPSLALRRFKGCECFFFFFEEPLAALSGEEWTRLITTINRRRESGLQVTAFDSIFAYYRPGERAHLRVRVANRRLTAVSCVLRLSVKYPGKNLYTPLIELRRVPEGGCETEAQFNFKPDISEAGMLTLRLQVLQDVGVAEILSNEGHPDVIDQREIGVMLAPEHVVTKAIISTNGPSIVVDDEEGFLVGTHYYPSTSWWEWVWRDFHPLAVANDLAAIRRAGYRIVRVWVDPVIDETVLRAMDATILLAAANGLVLDICVFTQWTRKMGFERVTGEHVSFNFRGPRDFNVVSFSLRNLDLQREFLQILAARWKDAGNILYDLANEVFIRDPDASQMDREALQWKDIPSEKGILRDSLLFKRWGDEMTNVIRKAGGRQIVFPGYMFSVQEGGDVYTGNENAPILPWHSYAPFEQTGITLDYFDPISSNKPVLLEEMGALGWNNEKHYDGTVHYALSSGAAGVMSYEWGISWLSRESCFFPLPLRDTLAKDPDPRWFPAYLNICKSWPEKGVGLCPTPSGTGYGSAYHGTPFAAAAATALGRLGLMGGGLQRVSSPEETYLIIPHAAPGSIKTVGDVIQALWSAKIIFSTWQEKQLSSLPSSTKTVIAPATLSPASEKYLDGLRANGVRLCRTAKDLRSVKGVELSSAFPTELLTRKTKAGRLLTVVSKQQAGNIELNYQGHRLSLHISDYAMAHIGDKGILLVEGEGKVVMDGATYCTISTGRVIIASEDGSALGKSREVRLMATKPCSIVFGTSIAGVEITDGFGKRSGPVSMQSFSGKRLTIDDQLIRYVIIVRFKK